MTRPRAIPAGARARAEVPSAWLPVEENWKLAEVVGGRTHPPPPHQEGVTTACRRSGARSPKSRAVKDLTTSAMSSSKMEQLETWSREAITSVRVT